MKEFSFALQDSRRSKRPDTKKWALLVAEDTSDKLRQTGGGAGRGGDRGGGGVMMFVGDCGGGEEGLRGQVGLSTKGREGDEGEDLCTSQSLPSESHPHLCGSSSRQL